MIIWFVGVLEIYFGLSLLGDSRSFAMAVSHREPRPCGQGGGIPHSRRLGRAGGRLYRAVRRFRHRFADAIALSLVKRIPDFLCGAPGLWLWRRMEGKMLEGMSLEGMSLLTIPPRTAADTGGWRRFFCKFNGSAAT